MMRYCLFVICILMFGYASADNLLTEKETRKLSDQAAQLLAAENTDAAFHLMKPYWPIPESEINDIISQTDNQKPLIASRFGKSLGAEFIKKETVGRSFIRYTYIQKFENHALRWMFTYYKPSDKWLVNSVEWDDAIDLLFD